LTTPIGSPPSREDDGPIRATHVKSRRSAPASRDAAAVPGSTQFLIRKGSFDSISRQRPAIRIGRPLVVKLFVLESATHPSHESSGPSRRTVRSRHAGVCESQSRAPVASPRPRLPEGIHDRLDAPGHDHVFVCDQPPNCQR